MCHYILISNFCTELTLDQAQALKLTLQPEKSLILDPEGFYNIT